LRHQPTVRLCGAAALPAPSALLKSVGNEGNGSAKLDSFSVAAILNYMVKYDEPILDRTFAALADPTRRALLARLGKRDGLSVSELAQPFAMSLPAIMKHLDVLSDAGLIARTKTGRTVACRLTAGPMQRAMDWLNRYQRFWSDNLDRLAAFVEEDRWPSNQPPSATPVSSGSRASPSSAASPRALRKSTRRGPTRKK
jgi:DNA-binding transcriptional ArsR family regulator